MPPTCPDCGGAMAVFAVPGDLRDQAPEGAARVALCADCLRVHPTDAAPTTGPDRPLADVVPAGYGGAALALAVGLLDSLALRRAAVVECVEYAERRGVDVHLALDRLAREVPDAHVDVARRRTQLDAFL